MRHSQMRGQYAAINLKEKKKQLKHQQAPAKMRITIHREYVDAPPMAYSMGEL